MPKSKKKQKCADYRAPQQRRPQGRPQGRPAAKATPTPVAKPVVEPVVEPVAQPVTRAGSRQRVVLGFLALAAAFVVLLGGQGTYAYWNDTATVNGNGFSSGKLDITVNAKDTHAETTLALATMVPGESVAANLTIANVGDADFRWVPTVSKAGGLGPALEVRMFLGGNQSGDDATYPRTETCNGGTALVSGTTETRLNVGAANQTVCVQVTLPADTDNSFQNKNTGSVSLALLATQVIA